MANAVDDKVDPEIQAELDAMQAAYDALEGLDAAARLRAMRWLAAKLNVPMTG